MKYIPELIPCPTSLRKRRGSEGVESERTMKTSVTETAKILARELRKRQTRAESILWSELRNRKFLGKKFLRQHPIFFEYKKVKAFFIADFYCHEHRLVLEVDGKNHDYQKEYDEYRTHVVNVLGMRVVRFENEQVQKNLNKVLESLSQVLRDGG